MKKIPFLNEKGEVVGTGTATINQDGFEAIINIDAEYDVLKSLETSAISISYSVNNPNDYTVTSGVAKPLKDTGEWVFPVQEVKR